MEKTRTLGDLEIDFPIARLITLILFTIVPHLIANAGEGMSGRLEVGISSLYDNNILRYSDKYITLFDNRQDPGRFHNNTLDDVILVNSFRLTAATQFIGSLNTSITADFRRRTYTHNSIKDWAYYAFGVRQDISRAFAAQIGYSYIPTFYVRHFRADAWTKLYGYKDPIVFQPFGYGKDETGGWVQYTPISGTRVRVVASFARYFYNEHFTEYDCTNKMGGLEVYQTIQKNIKVSAGFEFVASRGDGTVDMNPSYDQNIYSIGAELQLPKVFGRMNSIAAEGEYAYSAYTSKHFLEIDDNHAGREDFSYRFAFTYNFNLLDRLNLALAYAWHQRNVETKAARNADYLSAEKDYRQYQIGLDARYSWDIVP